MNFEVIIRKKLYHTIMGGKFFKWTRTRAGKEIALEILSFVCILVIGVVWYAVKRISAIKADGI